MTGNSLGWALASVLFLGGVNWVATEIIVTSVIFEDVREAVIKLGARVEERHPRIGRKVSYFCKCALCVGIWIGFAEAIVLGGPLHPGGIWAWSAFIVNGLIYKFVGHLLLQVNAAFHNAVELLQQHVRLTKNRATISRIEALERSATSPYVDQNGSPIDTAPTPAEEPARV